VDARRMAAELGIGPTETVRQVLDSLGIKPKASKPRSSRSRKKN
jgi:hypothetical protein